MDREQALKVIIVGGGYAGLTAMIGLYHQHREIQITLIDPSDDHVKLTRLHESFRKPLDPFRLPFSLLEHRFGIRHLKSRVALEPEDLVRYQNDKTLQVEGKTLPFDVLLLAYGSGLRTVGLENSTRTLTLDDFSRTPGPTLLDQSLPQNQAAWITVVGSGATGIQFLFEIDDYLRKTSSPWKLRLVDSGQRPLAGFSPGVGDYVRARLEERSIEYLPGHYFLQQNDQDVVLEDRLSYERHQRPSDLTLYFSGKTSKTGLKTNGYGQVKVEGKTLKSIFSAGDCAQFGSPGSNSLTAQSAVRKGKLVAQNIVKQGRFFDFMKPYLHRDLGYVISMGSEDAIGWLGRPKNIIAGAPALSIKEIVESQYDLLLAGTDTFAL